MTSTSLEWRLGTVQSFDVSTKIGCLVENGHGTVITFSEQKVGSDFAGLRVGDTVKFQAQDNSAEALKRA